MPDELRCFIDALQLADLSGKVEISVDLIEVIPTLTLRSDTKTLRVRMESVKYAG